MKKEFNGAKVYNMSDFRRKSQETAVPKKEATTPKKNKSSAKVVHMSHDDTKSHSGTFSLSYFYRPNEEFTDTRSSFKQEFDKSALYSQKITGFLKKSAEFDLFHSPETNCTVRKGTDGASFAAADNDAYVIEFERPIGANRAKDKSFYGYLSSIFGKSSIEFEAVRTSRYKEKASFTVKGEDLALLHKIKGYAAKIAK